MKLVQLIRPLLITAIGLHAALLFVPIGPDEAVVVEDVELSELSAGESTKNDKATPPSPGALPVPDPNVTTAATAAKTAAAPATVARSATSRAATPRTAASARSATATRSAANATNTPSPASNTSGSSSSGSSTNTASNGSSNSGSTDSNGTAASSTGRRTFIATSGDSSSEESSSTERNVASNSASGSNSDSQSSNTQTVDVETPLTVSSLLAKVTQEIPQDFQAFVDTLHRSLTYSAKNTDDASADDTRADWQATIQSQANVGQIGQMPTAEISDLTEIDYPLESSLKLDGRSLSRCLDPKPAPAEIGVLFDSRGEIVGEPELIRSTGYGALNEEIQALVTAYDDFPRDRNSKAYTFEVEVNYDAESCVSLTNLREDMP